MSDPTIDDAPLKRQLRGSWKHGLARRGKSRSPTYHSWAQMLTRCTNPNYHYFARYGGRGIKVCERWFIFEDFLADMGERPPGTALDRIDNDQGYCLDNCHWADRLEQSRNRSMAHMVLLNGERVCFSEAAEKLGVPVRTMQSWRRSKGITHQETVNHYANRKR